MIKPIAPLLLLALLDLAACGLTDRHVESCGDHCPNIGDSGSSGDSGTRTSGQGGSTAGDGGHPAGSGGAGRNGGSGGTGAADSGTSGSPDGGAEAGSSGMGGSGGEASSCDACPAQAPHCQAGACVECSEDVHCGDGVCVDNHCAECREDKDCGDAAASRCDGTHHCVRCGSSRECEHIEGLPVCTDTGCRQCSGSDNTACGTTSGGEHHVCDGQTKTCTTELEHSAGLCDPCVSDAQCKAGQLCVMQTYDDPSDSPDQGALEVGYFCFWREDSAEANGPAGDCANARPFFATKSGATSIDGVRATVCGLRVTTCAGYKDYSSKACTGAGDDASCGDDRFSDGYCKQASASTYRCTTPCLSSDDCKTGSTCNTSVTPNYCNLQ